MTNPTHKQRHNVTSAARKKAFRHGRVSCDYCGKGLTKQTATGDHKQAISKGGQNKVKNIVMACGDCNTRKGSMERGLFIAMLRAEGTYRKHRK